MISEPVQLFLIARSLELVGGERVEYFRECRGLKNDRPGITWVLLRSHGRTLSRFYCDLFVPYLLQHHGLTNLRLVAVDPLLPPRSMPAIVGGRVELTSARALYERMRRAQYERRIGGTGRGEVDLGDVG